ncbi:MAG: DNA mismatch repair endonuclease MutL [Porphyromonas sp.]|nr:DNA mismatch repair endonuclease MutL [Porphyromonas sp.]
MKNIINLLPDNIANQIAAGEVIQRPASVIKELVENSIDAGATEIEIEILDAGRTLLRVIDNGKGMSPIDARMAFERHATSKIKTADDLFRLCTMGFRGEALPSIAAVAEVELITRQHDEDTGVRIELKGGQVVSNEIATCPPGSIFSVKNIFHEIPARRKFLKTNDTEFRRIQTEIYRIAAVCPQIRFRLSHQGKVIFDYHPGELKKRLLDLFGHRLESKILKIEAETPLVRICGFTSTPSECRKRGAQQYFFVNDRFMKHSYFHRMLMNAYEGMIPLGDMPDYFIYLYVDPSSIDVNIHPTKTEIKFENETYIGQILNTVLRETLMKGAVAHAIDFTQDKIDIPNYKSLSDNELVEPNIGGENTDYIPSFNPDDYKDFGSFELGTDLDWEGFYKEFEKDSGIAASRSGHIKVKKRTSSLSSPSASQESDTTIGIITRSSSIEPDRITPPDSFLMPTQEQESSSEEPDREQLIILRQRYIITADGDSLSIVDAHQAARAISHHKYMARLLASKPVSQPLMFPELLTLNTQEAQLLHRYMDELREVGYDLTDMGGNTFSLVAIPEGMPADPDLLVQILHESKHVEKKSKEIVLEQIVSSMVKALHKRTTPILRREEAETLLRSLRKLPESRVTFDGHTILSKLTGKEIEKRFG